MSLFVSQTLKFFFLLTALVLAALSAQMIMEGVRAFLK